MTPGLPTGSSSVLYMFGPFLFSTCLVSWGCNLAVQGGTHDNFQVLVARDIGFGHSAFYITASFGTSDPPGHYTSNNREEGRNVYFGVFRCERCFQSNLATRWP